jgi:integrase
VPKAVQHIIGKTKFYETTGTSDLKIAQSLASLKVIKWKAEIATARTATEDPILSSATELKRLLGSSPSHLVKEIIEEQTEKLLIEKGELVASTFNAVATGKTKLLVNFIPEWINHQRKRTVSEKTITQMKSDVDQLISYLPTSNLLIHKHTSLWIKLIAKNGNLSASSVTRIIGSCRNFYKYLKYVDEIPEDEKEVFIVPKEYKISKGKNTKAINLREPWIPFENDELIQIYIESAKKSDIALCKLIRIAAYTGARIEEICSLHKEHVSLNKESIKIIKSKTNAGERLIPIHSDILPLVNELLKNEDPVYLIPNLTKSKYDDRSNAIGKRFGRLKKKMSFSKLHVFHSIRKTVSTQLENALVLENISADILGHQKPNMTYGHYSGGTILDVKRKAIQNLHYDFPVELEQVENNDS